MSTKCLAFTGHRSSVEAYPNTLGVRHLFTRKPDKQCVRRLRRRPGSSYPRPSPCRRLPIPTLGHHGPCSTRGSYSSRSNLLFRSDLVRVPFPLRILLPQRLLVELAS